MNRRGKGVGKGQAEQREWHVQGPVCPASWGTAQGRRGQVSSRNRLLINCSLPSWRSGRAQGDQPLGDLNSAPGAGTAWLCGLGKLLSSSASVSCL